MDSGLPGVVAQWGKSAACRLGCMGAGHSASHWLTQSWRMRVARMRIRHYLPQGLDGDTYVVSHVGTFVDSHVGAYVVSCIDMYVNSCEGTYIVSHLVTYVVSRLVTYVDSRSNFVLLDAWSNLIRLDAHPGLDVGAFFDGDHLVVGGAESNIPDKPGGAKLLTAGLLGLGHNVPAIGLHAIGHLLDGLLLVVARLPVVLNNGGLRLYRVLHLVANLCLQLLVYVLGLKVVTAMMSLMAILVHVSRE